MSSMDLVRAIIAPIAGVQLDGRELRLGELSIELPTGFYRWPDGEVFEWVHQAAEMLSAAGRPVPETAP